MKQTPLSISLSVFFLVLGVVFFYQSSSPDFISLADKVNSAMLNLSALLTVAGVVCLVLAGAVIYIQYLITTKRGK